MILTTEQARYVAQEMKAAKKISIDMLMARSTAERVKVVHEPVFTDRVMVWQQIGGITHNDEMYGSRAEFLAAYGVQ